MTLQEALLRIGNRPKESAEEKRHYLVCGFEPLHLKTFLHAHLIEHLPESAVAIEHGVYGDLPGNLESAAKSSALAAGVILEWSDLDPRLGLRSAGGWSADSKRDIPSTVESSLARIESAIERLSRRMPVGFAAPSLPLPPIGSTISRQFSKLELAIHYKLGSFLKNVAGLPGVRIVNPFGPELVACRERLDPRHELIAGFPYTLRFADALAAEIVAILYPPPPKKGLITDLDDTLWSGIVGEVGAKGVSWHQEHHTQAHGLYQQMLGHLASTGVLIAACSKNETEPVEAALARTDLMLDAKSLFPVCASWEPKSQSVARILRAWNIAADAVVFVDDSPMELEEVRRAFPGMTCLQFHPSDPAKVWHLLSELRDLFGKPFETEEDALRQQSVRTSAMLQEMGESAASPEFLQSLRGKITLDWRINADDKRPLELINKTNQFNLNGIRIAEGEWQRYLEDPRTILAVVSYADKFGPLGKIAVLLAEQNETSIQVRQWVMSCRAFSRNVEHHTLRGLFRRFPQIDAIEFAFQPTERNGPLRDFFREAGICSTSGPHPQLSRPEFVSRYPALPHEFVDLTESAPPEFA